MIKTLFILVLFPIIALHIVNAGSISVSRNKLRMECKNESVSKELILYNPSLENTKFKIENNEYLNVSEISGIIPAKSKKKIVVTYEYNGKHTELSIPLVIIFGRGYSENKDSMGLITSIEVPVHITIPKTGIMNKKAFFNPFFIVTLVFIIILAVILK